MPQPQQCEIWAMSVTYTTVHGNARSSTHWAEPGIKPMSSWIPVGFITIEPQWELLGGDFYHRVVLTSLIITKQQQSDSCYRWLPISVRIYCLAQEGGGSRRPFPLTSVTEVCLSEVLRFIPLSGNLQATQSWPCVLATCYRSHHPLTNSVDRAQKICLPQPGMCRKTGFLFYNFKYFAWLWAFKFP